MARYIDADKLKMDSDIDNFDMPYGCSFKVIDEQPTADVEEIKHGRWMPQIVLGHRAWDCSECKTLGSPQWKRCPVCEAKMDAKNDFRE